MKVNYTHITPYETDYGLLYRQFFNGDSLQKSPSKNIDSGTRICMFFEAKNAFHRNITYLNGRFLIKSKQP